MVGSIHFTKCIIHLIIQYPIRRENMRLMPVAVAVLGGCVTNKTDSLYSILGVPSMAILLLLVRNDTPAIFFWPSSFIKLTPNQFFQKKLDFKFAFGYWVPPHATAFGDWVPPHATFGDWVPPHATRCRMWSSLNRHLKILEVGYLHMPLRVTCGVVQISICRFWTACC